MKIAIVASSVPSAGKRPAIPQQVGFTTTPRGIALAFANTGLVVFKEKLIVAEDILAVAPVPEDVLRPYGESAARTIKMNQTLALSFLGHFGHAIQEGLANQARADAANSTLAGCAIVYKNSKGHLVSLLLCGLVADILDLIEKIPAARHSKDLPPPFSVELLRKIVADKNKPITFDY
jgi:hypothetical protein